MNKNEKNFLICIGGPSGSGKTTVLENIIKKLNQKNLTNYIVIKQDDYYKTNNGIPMEERVKINYDHPNQFDNELLIKHLKMLLDNKQIKKPIYDFENHNRKKEKVDVFPSKVIVLEGILALESKEIRNLSNLKLFVDTDLDLCLLRRIKRDISERGRNLDGVLKQYLATVKPMLEQFVYPCKKYADVIIPEGGNNKNAINLVSSSIISKLI